MNAVLGAVLNNALGETGTSPKDWDLSTWCVTEEMDADSFAQLFHELTHRDDMNVLSKYSPRKCCQNSQLSSSSELL